MDPEGTREIIEDLGAPSVVTEGLLSLLGITAVGEDGAPKGPPPAPEKAPVGGEAKKRDVLPQPTKAELMLVEERKRYTTPAPSPLIPREQSCRVARESCFLGAVLPPDVPPARAPLLPRHSTELKSAIEAARAKAEADTKVEAERLQVRGSSSS